MPPLARTGTAALAAALLTLPAADARAGSPAADRVERSVADAIGDARARAGLARLDHDRALRRIADRHSRAMARTGCLCHGSFSARLRSATAGRGGETLALAARGPRLARRVVAQWMASPPHRAVLLDPGARRIGVARRGSSRGWYFTADLAGRR